MSEELLKQFVEMSDEELRDFVKEKQAECQSLEDAIQLVRRTMAERRAEQAPKTIDFTLGACPECGWDDTFLNIGRDHWLYCEEHKTKWFVGSNLFGTWRHETEEGQRKLYDSLQFGEYTEVKPIFEAGEMK